MSAAKAQAPQDADITITERALDMVEVAARRGRADGIAAELGGALALAPGRWLAVAEAGAPGSFLARLTAALGAAASLVELSSAYRVIRIAGPLARETLSRGCRLDLHPRAFPPGKAARTVMAQIAVILHRDDAGEATVPVAFDLYVPATLAASFLHHLHRWAQAARDSHLADQTQNRKLSP